MSNLTLYASTTYPTPGVTISHDYSKKSLASGGNHGSATTNQTETMPFSSNVVVLGQNPDLVVNANGTITTDENVSVTTLSNPATIVIDDIAGPAGGNVDFNSQTISGSTGTWTFSLSYSNVQIVNNSNENLEIDNISVANASAQPHVWLNATNSNTLNFNIDQLAVPTQVTIDNYGSSNVLINGTIDNPIGTTTIVNTGGSILATIRAAFPTLTDACR